MVIMKLNEYYIIECLISTIQLAQFNLIILEKFISFIKILLSVSPLKIILHFIIIIIIFFFFNKCSKQTLKLT